MNENYHAASSFNKSVSRGDKSMCKFRKEKNQHATSFMNETLHQFREQKSAGTKFHEQNSFKVRKIDVQV